NFLNKGLNHSTPSCTEMQSCVMLTVLGVSGISGEARWSQALMSDLLQMKEASRDPYGIL
ncbi:hypothetical protein AMECASPLE_002659, partial [Ameca splendens]